MKLQYTRSQVFLGVDGGASGTRALLINASGAILGAGTGGNANHAGQGYRSAVSHITHAVHGACREAQIALEHISFAHFAVAGNDVEDDQIQLTKLLAEELPDLKFYVTNDVWAGLRAGSIDGTGIAVNCGSGAGAVGRSPTGAQQMIADLGYMFGDSGGGNQIGVDAIRAVVRAWDGRGDATSLTDAVLNLVGLSDTAALYLALYREQVGAALIRQCTRLVFQCAASGDTVAIEILTRIGAEFGRSAVALARRLSMQDLAFPFVLTGGAIRTLQSPLVEAAVAQLQSVCPRCRPTSPRLMPVAGAALLALDASEVPVTEEHFLRLSAQGQGWHPEERYAWSGEESQS